MRNCCSIFRKCNGSISFRIVNSQTFCASDSYTYISGSLIGVKLLFLCHCRFTGNVKLKGIIIIGGEDDSHPAFMKL